MARPGKMAPRDPERFATKPGEYADGGNLYLRVTNPGVAHWRFRYMVAGKARVMGLGAFPVTTLTAAREKALAAKRLAYEGKDPLDEKRVLKATSRAKQDRAKTFQQCSDAYYKSKRLSWSNDKHETNWFSRMKLHAYPLIGALPVASINQDLVLQVLMQAVSKGGQSGPYWEISPVSAQRLRGQIESVLGWATAKGLREGDNPAAWTGRLEFILPNRPKGAEAHYASLPYKLMSKFMGDLRLTNSTVADMLEFVILTAARASEARFATWGEVDFEERLWVIEKSRMKARTRPHRVFLSDAAIAVLKKAKDKQEDPAPSDLIFPDPDSGAAIQIDAMRLLARRVSGQPITTHGFRSAFKTWAIELTRYPSDLSEIALHHEVGTKVEQAYRRGDMLEARKALMRDWAIYCGYAEGNRT